MSSSWTDNVPTPIHATRFSDNYCTCRWIHRWRSREQIWQLPVILFTFQKKKRFWKLGVIKSARLIIVHSPRLKTERSARDSWHIASSAPILSFFSHLTKITQWITRSRWEISDVVFFQIPLSYISHREIHIYLTPSSMPFFLWWSVRSSSEKISFHLCLDSNFFSEESWHLKFHTLAVRHILRAILTHVPSQKIVKCFFFHLIHWSFHFSLPKTNYLNFQIRFWK